jgi:hypothetical protein
LIVRAVFAQGGEWGVVLEECPVIRVKDTIMKNVDVQISKSSRHSVSE